jgi:hypothetical protein
MTECVAIITYTGADGANVDGSKLGQRVGGLVGQDDGNSTITDSYAVSSLMKGEKTLGGLIGRAAAALSITNCYSASTVTEVFSEFGSFGGALKAATVTNSYWDSDLQTEGVGSGDNASDVDDLTTANFETSSNFVGWNFTNIWTIGDVNGVQRPYLQWLDMTPLSVDEISLVGSLLRVYPNPVTSRLTIENAPLNAQFSLINLLGQELFSGTIEGTSIQLNVESYNKGIYILRVGDQTRKIIIE